MRTPGRLLAAHTVLRTRSMEEFHAYITSMVGSHARRIDAGRTVEIELRHATLGRLDIGLHHSSATVTVESTQVISQGFLVQFPLTGEIDLEVDGRHYSIQPDTGLVISPGQRVRRTGGPGWTLAVQASTDLVLSCLQARFRRRPRGLLTFLPRITAHASELRDYAVLMAEAIDREVAAPGTAIAAVLEEGFAGLLIDTQPHSLGKDLSRTESTARSRRVQALAAHVDEHLETPFTVADLAAHAGCSIRSLQATFAEFCGLSPMEWIRRRRMSTARRRLQAGQPGDTVSGIALRCGFSHIGRFSTGYKAMYGESPSETLKRALAGPRGARTGTR